MRLADLARGLGVNKATVTRWAQKEIPLDRLKDIEHLTGIPAAELRPDAARIFAPAPSEAAQ